MARFFFLLPFLCLFGNVFAKHKDTAGYYDIFLKEKRINAAAPLMIEGETDSIRIATAWNLYRCLDTMLNMPASRFYPFDSLRHTVVSILQPKDQAFRLFTFNLILLNGNFQNFGYIEIWSGKESEIVPLIDTAKKTKPNYLETELETTEWLGALYYNLVPFKKGKNKYYILNGFDGASANSNKKIIDVLWFDNHVPVFGKPLFLDGSQDRKPAFRVVYEFHNESQMLLRYEENRKIIVLDKLTPSFPEAVNDFYYYIPSGDYDYYAINKKGYWVKEALENLNLGQGEKPLRPVEKPKPESIEPPVDHR